MSGGCAGAAPSPARPPPVCACVTIAAVSLIVCVIIADVPLFDHRRCFTVCVIIVCFQCLVLRIAAVSTVLLLC